MPPKQMGMALTALGAVLVVGAIVSLNVGDLGKWFPILLIAGGTALWFGIKKYRWA
jgi:hypothetical protein